LSGEKLNNTEIISDNISDEIIKIKNQPGKSIMIFGSPSVSRIFMQHDLIDSYWIFVNPTIFGEGIPLFTSLPNKIKLKLAAAKQFANGEFALNYIVDKESNSDQSTLPFIWQS
jgi:dihydrofolate reductase